MFFVEAKEKERRLGICHKCKFYQESTKSCGTLLVGDEVTYRKKKVRLCGCRMPVKAKLKAMSCPLGKWKPWYKPEDMERLTQVLDAFKGRTVTHTMNNEMTEWYNKLTGDTRQPSTCRPCIQEMVSRLRTFVADVQETEQMQKSAKK